MKNAFSRIQSRGLWPMAVAVAVLLLLLPPSARAADQNPPERMIYQGFLVDGAGVALGNTAPKNFDVIFRIWKGSSTQLPGDLLWTEQQTVTVDKGYFSVLLGEGATVGGENHGDISSVFSGADASDRWVGITVKGLVPGTPPTDAVILPRLRLLSSPYAFAARKAASLVSPNGTELVTSANGELTVNGTIMGNGSMTVSGTLTATGAIEAPSVTATGNLEAAAFIGAGSQLTGLTAGQIPSLDASKINSGTLSSFRIPGLNASKITSGTLSMSGGYAGMIETKFSDNDRFGMTFINNNISTAIYHSQHNSSSKIQFGKMTGASSFSPQMTIRHDGKIGIGTDNPTKAHVEIAATGGTYTYTSLNRVWSISSPGAWKFTTPATADASLWADGHVVAPYFVAPSDERIKNIIGRSDRIQDLARLRQLEVSDYVHKDVVAHGNRPQKKVIAQQVEKVFPQAVSKTKQCIPDIYKRAELSEGWVQLHTDLKVGERIKILGDGLNTVLPVIALAPGRFQLALGKKLRKVFVFGREVDDFRVVDYDALNMLHLSATQELARRLEVVEQRETRMESLEAEVAALKRMVTQLVAAGSVSRKTAQVQSPSGLIPAILNR